MHKARPCPQWTYRLTGETYVHYIILQIFNMKMQVYTWTKTSREIDAAIRLSSNRSDIVSVGLKWKGFQEKQEVMFELSFQD